MVNYRDDSRFVGHSCEVLKVHNLHHVFDYSMMNLHNITTKMDPNEHPSFWTWGQTH